MKIHYGIAHCTVLCTLCIILCYGVSYRSKYNVWVLLFDFCAEAHSHQIQLRTLLGKEVNTVEKCSVY